jgi:hypothetical protein
MRPPRFQTFAVEALSAAPEITAAEPWTDDRPYGIHVRFNQGSELWAAITGALASGERHDSPDTPVAGDPPAQVPVPELYDGGQISPTRAEQYIAATLTNSGNPELRTVYPYGPDAKNPGVGVTFHNGARAFILFAHTARTGQGKGGRPFDLQSGF